MSFLKRIIKKFPCQEKQVGSCQFQSPQSPFICRYISNSPMLSNCNSMMLFNCNHIKIIKEMIIANNKTIPLMYLQHSDRIIKSFAKYLLKLPHCPFPRNKFIVRYKL